MTTYKVNYMYDASDMRLYKKVDSVGTVLKEEYYLRDATGRELAVIDNSYNVNWYIYGKERVASMRHQLSVGMDNLFITGNIPDGLHHARNALSTDGTVQSSDNVILQAGDCVPIMPGFSTPDDADFTAEIKNNPVPHFVYYLYDHLGNTRVTYSVEVNAADDIDYVVESATDYYPYGKALRSYGRERYQSTYHERDVESGFDYRGARFYDGDVGRFNSLDPLAADYPSLSDYVYVAGNPLTFTDKDGKKVTIPQGVRPTNITGIALHYVATAIIGAQPYWAGEVTYDVPLLGTGRADLVYQGPDGKNAVWEIKPVSNRKKGSTKHKKAQEQLERYRQLAEAQTGMPFSTGSSGGAPSPFQGTKKVSFVSGFYQYEASLFIPAGQENKGLIYYTLDSRKLTPAGERALETAKKAAVVAGAAAVTAVAVATLPVTAPTAAAMTAVAGVAATIAVSSDSEANSELAQ